MKKSNKKGFTILELLVVVAIIAILAVIAIPQFMGAIDKSRVSAQIADMASVSKAVIMYNFDTSLKPTGSITGLANTSAEGDYGMIGTYTRGAGVTTGGPFTHNVLLANDQVMARAANAVTVTNGTNPNWNGPYMNTYPANNKWGGNFTYKVVDAALVTAATGANLVAGQVVIELTGVPAAQLAKLDAAVDGTAGVGTGVLRVTSETTPRCFYIVMNN